MKEKGELIKDQTGGVSLLPVCILFVILAFPILAIGLFISITKWKSNKKLSVIVLIISLILIALLPISFYSYYNYRSNQPNNISYAVDIKTNTTANYTILIPFLEYDEMETAIEISSGTGEINIINSNRTDLETSAEALMLKSQDDILLQAHFKSDEWAQMTLCSSFKEYGIGKYWIWCEKENIIQNISISIDAEVFQDYIYHSEKWNTGDRYETEPIFIKNGWNKINVFFTREVA